MKRRKPMPPRKKPVEEKLVVPKWLTKIQQNSWEPEILLSGFVLVGLIQLPRYLDQTSEYFQAEILGNNLLGLFSGLKLVVYILISGLISHLFLRGIWIGFVGLSYTFPQGIKSERFRFQPKFQAQIEKMPKPIVQVDKLEKICSSIFSLCFFLIMLIFGLLVSILLFIGLIYLLDYLTKGIFMEKIFLLIGENLDNFISAVVLIITIDFVFTGLFRKHKWIARIYYPLHTLISWMTLSRFYRPIYYTFASNINRWVFSSALLVFVSASLFSQIALNSTKDDGVLSKMVLYDNDLSNSLFSGYYLDRNEEWHSVKAAIPKPIVDGRFLEVTLKLQISLEKSILAHCGKSEEALKIKNDKKIGAEKLACIASFYEVWIDDVKYESPDWMFTYYQKDKAKALVAFLDIQDLAVGKHILEIRIPNEKQPLYSRIVFFKS